MTTIYEYMELYTKKDPKLMDIVGMNRRQKESIYNKCRWSAAVLERIANDIQTGELTISPDSAHVLSIIMKSVDNDCRKCK